VFGHDVNRDTAAVVGNCSRAVVVYYNPNIFGKTRESFVIAVIDNFSKAVMEAADISRTDIHGGALTDRGQTFEDDNVFAGVVTCWHKIFSEKSKKESPGGCKFII